MTPVMALIVPGGGRLRAGSWRPHTLWPQSSAHKNLPMFPDAHRDFLEKYKKSIDEIIQRYKHIDDTYDDIVNIDKSDELDTLQIQDVSFIRRSSRRASACQCLFSLEDIYARLCRACDFEDIVHFLG